MKLRIVIAAALAAIVVCVWLLMRDDAPPVPPETAVGTRGTTSAGAAPRATSSAAPSEAASKQQGENVNWKALRDISGGKLDALKTPATAQIEEFLRKRGETAINLLVAWEVTRDRRWLDRALELFPNDPALLLATIGTTPAPDNIAELIQRLKRAAPDNPLAWVYEARRLFSEMHVAEATAELRTALNKPGFYTYASERILAGKQLYLDAGLDPIGAEYMAMSQLQLPHLQAARDTVRAMKEATGAEGATPENRAEFIKLSYDMGRMFATPEASRTLIGQLVGVAMEREALTLAQSQTSNPLPVDPAARLAEIDRFRAAIPGLASVTEKLLIKDDANLFAEYMRRFRTEGEGAALKWVGEQMR